MHEQTYEEIVSARWQAVLEDENVHVRRIAERAVREPVLRPLFPFGSHNDLWFSRRVEHPYDRNLPHIHTTFDEYEARAEDNSVLCSGNIETVVVRVTRAMEATGVARK